LQAVLRTPAGATVYHGLALASEELSGNYADSGQNSGALLGCPPGAAVTALVFGSGLSARGPVRCS
ncbi:MAG: hypothetical protein ACYDCH_14285, partial [Gaiellaceae bacterium]